LATPVPETLAPLPPVFGGTANPANSGGNNNGGGNNNNNGNGRPRRNNGPSADNGGLSGPIGQTNAFEPYIDSQDQQNNQFNNRRN